MFPQIFGKYVLEREIAAGGMARVYLATLRGAVGFEKRLVVKQIRPELAVDAAFVRRFVEEAKTAVELNHPNIVPVYELGVEQGIYYIAMEHCPGVTLSEVLSHTGPLDPEEGAVVGAEVCRALDYAHRRAGIVHRDVTPRNVLLDDEGAVRLIDFGIAAPADPGTGRTREVFGSPGHMPPEQLRGEPLTPAADVFAVAALLIETWTGLAPFRRGTAEASAKALTVPPPALGESVPGLAPLDELISRSVALDVARRPAGAEELGRGLRDFARSADSGEIARRLGARVRRVRDRLRPRASPVPDGDGVEAASVRDSTPPLVTPTGSTTATRTFAARDEMVEWTRRLSSVPPGSTPSSSPSAPSSSPTLGSGARVRSTSNDIATGGERAGDHTRRLSSRPPSAAPGARSVAPRGGRRFRVGPVPLGLGVVAAAVLGATLARRATPPPASGVPPQGATAPATAPDSPAASDHPLPAAEPAAPEATPEPAPTGRNPEKSGLQQGSGPSAPLPERPTPSATTTVAPAEVRSATLKITADPPAIVSVEGGGFTQTSPTPLRALPLVPGTYRVSFRSETYGSPVTSQVTLAAGAQRSVHADFRAAVPTVTVR